MLKTVTLLLMLCVSDGRGAEIKCPYTDWTATDPNWERIAGPKTCKVNGEVLQAGDSYVAEDGCNTCRCGPGREVDACTKKACPLKNVCRNKCCCEKNGDIYCDSPSETDEFPDYTADQVQKGVKFKVVCWAHCETAVNNKVFAGGKIPPGITAFECEGCVITEIPAGAFGESETTLTKMKVSSYGDSMTNLGKFKALSELTALTSLSWTGGLDDVGSVEFPTSLTELKLGSNIEKITSPISFAHGKLSLTKLSLADNGLTNISRDAFDQILDLQELNLDNHKFKRLPPVLAKLTGLTKLNLMRPAKHGEGYIKTSCTCEDKPLATWYENLDPKPKIAGECYVGDDLKNITVWLNKDFATTCSTTTEDGDNEGEENVESENGKDKKINPVDEGTEGDSSAGHPTYSKIVLLLSVFASLCCYVFLK